MSDAINNIIKSGKEAGACPLLKDKMHINGLAKLLFTPQGIEFCAKRDSFLTIEMLRGLKTEHQDLDQRGLFIDYGSIQTSRKHVFIAGQSDVECVCKRPNYIYNIILAHGATALVRASDYAVVNVYAIGENCDYRAENDGTAVIFDHITQDD